MSRAINSGLRLRKEDIPLVKGMLHRGDRQHDIAAYFGVNGGRIADIKTRKKFSDILMTKDRLPPPGPYLSGKKSQEIQYSFKEINIELENLNKTCTDQDFKKSLEKIIKKINTVLIEV